MRPHRITPIHPDAHVFFNFNAFSEALPDSERYGGFINFDHKICGDQLVVYGDFFYQNVKTGYDLAATATGNFQTPGNITLAIPPHAPGPTLGGPSYEETGVPLGAYNPFNPFQQIISGGTRARLIEFGNRIIDNETNAFFSTLGLKGDKLFDGSWGYDASFRYSQVQNISTIHIPVRLAIQPHSECSRSHLRSHVLAIHRHNHSLQSVWRLSGADSI